MKKIFTIVLFGIYPFFAQSQGNLKEEVIPLMKSKETIDEAMKKTDDYLNEHPKDVDAMVLKGNVILNKFKLNAPEITMNANMDESIYNDAIGEIADNPVIVPVDIANQITDIYLKAVQIDDKRTDIFYGICYVYSISMQTDKLIAYLPVLQSHIEITPELPYSFADYARNLMDRDDFDDGMKVYDAVARMFEDNAGLYSDMAGEYFKAGEIEKTKIYIKKALKSKGLDEMSYGNAFFIYAVLEDYDNALSALKMQCDLNGSKNYLLYKSLVNLNRGQDWKSPLEEYNKTSNDLGNYKRLANFMRSDSFDNSPHAHLDISDIQLQDSYRILIEKYYKTILGTYLSSFNYAEILTNNFRYADAKKAFLQIDTSLIGQKELDQLHFFNAWACYKSKDQKTALNNWIPLLKSEDFYCQSAACYFIGKYYLEDKKDKILADSYFKRVSGRASESKYANFCRVMEIQNILH